MSTTRLRFAPSPTGRLHVGNIRTALVNWLFASKNSGEFILRMDDTDTSRSTDDNKEAIRRDLQWLGLDWDESFNQSDQFEKYDQARDFLIDKGLLYPCYENSSELQRKRRLARTNNRAPIYDRAALSLSEKERARLEAEGRKPHWRFKLSGEKCLWTDLVRGDQVTDTASQSDPVLIREDGSYLYMLPSVVDDIAHNITHIVRGEDHVTNSGIQIEIFRALGSESPELAHLPLLVGADGRVLAKRLEHFSVQDLREEGFEPLAINSLLARIGTSDNVEVASSVRELVENFEFDKIGRAPARFDESDVKTINASLIHQTKFSDVRMRLNSIDARTSQDSIFWNVFRANCNIFDDIKVWTKIVYGEIQPLVDPEDSEYIGLAGEVLYDTPFDADIWKNWTNKLKERTGRKGKNLFMPLRKALTGLRYGPEMATVLTMIGREKAIERLNRTT